MLVWVWVWYGYGLLVWLGLDNTYTEQKVLVHLFPCRFTPSIVQIVRYLCFLFKHLSFYRTNINNSSFLIVEVFILLKNSILLLPDSTLLT